MKFSLSFHARPGISHDDIVVTLGSYEYTCDSYYFAIDPHFPGEDAEKTLKTIKILLRQWLLNIESLAEGETIYLPYDFSDEYIACIRARRIDDLLYCIPGYTSIPGHSVRPSNIDKFIRESGISIPSAMI